MRKLGPLACALACAALAACSSIIEGTSQEITVNTNPAGADCLLNRQGLAVAHVSPTPGAATIKKTKDDITIVCNKDGFEAATYLDHSGAAGATVGNIVGGLLFGVGWAIDSASGADNKYDSPVNITLAPKVAAQGTGATTTATQPSGATEGAGGTTAPTQSPDSAQDATAFATPAGPDATSVPASPLPASVPSAVPQTAPAPAPQQQAMLPPSSSSPVASPAPARGRYDGEWRGTAGGTYCRAEINLTVANNAVSGKMDWGVGNVGVSGTVADDGSMTGKIASGTLSGKFEENQFKGAFIDPANSVNAGFQFGGGTASSCGSVVVILERVK